jgi:hypothetical protein
VPFCPRVAVAVDGEGCAFFSLKLTASLGLSLHSGLAHPALANLRANFVTAKVGSRNEHRELI